MDAIETRVLEKLAASRIPLDPTHLAERASLLPAETDHALRRLVRKDLAVRVPSKRRDRRDRYKAAN
jgi:DNA-binding MarR family transcriptional regulator